MSGVKHEPFAAVPDRVFRALAAHEIAAKHLILVTYLTYRCRRDGGETNATLETIASETRWPWSKELLRKALHELGGWFEVTAPPAGSSRAPWRFRPELQPEKPPTLEQSSNEWSSEAPANPHELIAQRLAEAPTVGAPFKAEQSRAKELPAVVPARFEHDFELQRLLDAIGSHADGGTRNVLKSYIEKHGLPAVAIDEAWRAVRKPGVRDRAALANAVLQDYVARKDAA